MINRFSIYGERCSGTNFLEKAILANFDLAVTWNYGWKHFFGHHDFTKYNNDDTTLFICIIRSPIDWIDSFFKELHHIPLENRLNLNTFLFNTFYSVYGNKETMEDRHIITKERYKNIFELRRVKNNFLIFDLTKLVKNYVIIKYEDLNSNYESVLEYIRVKFNLQKRFDIYKKIESHKGKNEKKYVKKDIALNDKEINIIKKNLDITQENILGYLT